MIARMQEGTAVLAPNGAAGLVVDMDRRPVTYPVCERTGDLTPPYDAELRVADNRILQSIDVSVCPPPHEVPSGAALGNDRAIVAVVGGLYAPTRSCYNPHNKRQETRYREQQQAGRSAWRPAQQ